MTLREDSTANAAYRLGCLDAMLHPDTLEKMTFPGIFLEQMQGERAYREAQLREAGIKIGARVVPPKRKPKAKPKART